MRQCIKFSAYFMLACLVGVTFGECVCGQSYSDTLLKGIKNRNSTNRYSVKNIQSRIAAQSVTPSGVNGLNRQSYTNVFSGAGGSPQRAKPFTGLQRGPAVSPYLQLNGSLDSVSDYYSYVQPQREQQRANYQQQRQLNANRHRLNQIAAQGAYNLAGDPNTPSTGHQTTYMYLGNYQTTGNYFPAVVGLDKQQQ